MNVQEVLDLYSKPTGFEEANDIEVVSKWLPFVDFPDLKFYVRYKSDQSMSLLMLHRQGLTDHWVGWMISEAQSRIMIEDFPRIYDRIQRQNKLVQRP